MHISSKLGFVIYSMVIDIAYTNRARVIPSTLRDEPVCVQIGKDTACQLPQSSCAPVSYGHDWNADLSLRESVIYDENMLKVREHVNPFRQLDDGFGWFNADYYGNFTTDQRHAVDHCMEEASYWWPSRIPVNVVVNFTQIEDSSALGSAQPMSLWTINNTIYPIALLKAMTGFDQNLPPRDVYITFNSAIKWFTGSLITDSPDGSEFDLITVCYHELMHGLFMSGGNIKVDRYTPTSDGNNDGNGTDSNNGYVATRCRPNYIGRFDSFLANNEGCSVVEAYKNTPQWLGDAFTSNNLWFATSNGTRIARLHAPRPYSQGTSVYHLSLESYDDQMDGNDLMTPVMGKGYRQHNIGAIMRQIIQTIVDQSNEHAKYCYDVGRPGEDQSTIDGGSGRGDSADDSENNSHDNSDTDNSNEAGLEIGQGGFTINIGKMTISGWLIIGVAVGFFLTVVTGAFAARAVIVSKNNHRVPRRTTRLDRVEMLEHGNAAEVV